MHTSRPRLSAFGFRIGYLKWGLHDSDRRCDSISSHNTNPVHIFVCPWRARLAQWTREALRTVDSGNCACANVTVYTIKLATEYIGTSLGVGVGVGIGIALSTRVLYKHLLLVRNRVAGQTIRVCFCFCFLFLFFFPKPRARTNHFHRWMSCSSQCLRAPTPDRRSLSTSPQQVPGGLLNTPPTQTDTHTIRKARQETQEPAMRFVKIQSVGERARQWHW